MRRLLRLGRRMAIGMVCCLCVWVVVDLLVVGGTVRLVECVLMELGGCGAGVVVYSYVEWVCRVCVWTSVT